MGKGKKGIGRLGVVLLAVCTIGILFGWTVYAQDSPAVDQDVGAVAQQALSGSPLTQPPPTPPVPGVTPAPLPLGILDTATQFMEQVSEGVLSLLNNNTNSDFYGGFSNPDAVDAAHAMVQRHFNAYCAGAETGNCPSDPLLQNGDIKISSILSGTAYDGASGPRTQAAQDFLTNLFVPPSGSLVANFASDLTAAKVKALDANVVTNDPKLLQKYTQALSDEAVLSAARQSFAEMISRRTISNSAAGSVSEMQVMEAEAIKRFMSAGWVQMVKNPTTTAAQLQQETVAMQAYQSWMAYQQFRQLERIEALLATLIVQNARTSKALAASIPTAPSGASISSAATGTGTGTGTGP